MVIDVNVRLVVGAIAVMVPAYVLLGATVPTDAQLAGLVLGGKFSALVLAM